MRPFEHLPIPYPKDYDPGPQFFYENFVKKFIPDIIGIMKEGMPIDDNAVEDLRSTITEVQKSVYERLEANLIVKAYRESRKPKLQMEHAEKVTQSIRDADYYIKVFKPSDVMHRTWVVNTYLKDIGKSRDCRDKWTLKDLKQYNVFLNDTFFKALIDKRPLSANKNVLKGMRAFAEYKAELWNRPREEKAEEEVVVPPFNPNSNKQLKELFEMLEIEPLARSKKTGEASWGRDQIEIVARTETDPVLQDLLEALIDNSYSAIIQDNFLNAFDKFTIDGVLYGNINLFGAKSFRNTSNSPNLLNMPSTKSIYAKPLKRCFTSGSDDFVIYTADLSALEDRVIANLTEDTNKCNIFLEGLDGHSLNACGYFPEEVAAIIGENTDNVAYVKKFMEFHESKNKLIDAIRQKSKAPTFKLAYGGFPDADKGGVITQEIFDNYHNNLYPGITDYRENYVLATARAQGYLHLGLGCRIYSDDPDSHIRTLHNATVQFWSILTLIAINELNYRAKRDGLSKWVRVNSTIYDSIYTRTYRDPEVIKWVNDNMIEVMTAKYLHKEIVSNEAEGEIGLNWADLVKVPNNASTSQIITALEECDELAAKARLGGTSK